MLGIVYKVSVMNAKSRSSKSQTFIEEEFINIYFIFSLLTLSSLATALNF